MELFSANEIREADRAERALGRVSRGRSHGSSPLVTAEYSAGILLDDLMSVTKRLRFHIGSSASLVESKLGKGQKGLKRLGKSLLIACRQYRELMLVIDGNKVSKRFQHSKLHPYLDVALNEIESAEAKVENAFQFGDHNGLSRELISLASAIHTRTNTKQFKQAVYNYERNADSKLRRALAYVLSLFAKRSRLLVLRVDLYVRPTEKAWGYSTDADAAFDKFAEALACNEIVPDVMGWMSAREDGVERGRHYHVIAFLDGHLHWSGASLTQLLGEYWVHACVGSSQVGSYFNCFALAKVYPHLGIGLVHCKDAKKLLGLFYAIRYLCKTEVQLIATGQRTRNFRRGVVDSSYVRRGAPRNDDDDLSLARSVLFGHLRQIKARNRNNTPASQPLANFPVSANAVDSAHRDALTGGLGA